jgi:hypothetical protein
MSLSWTFVKRRKNMDDFDAKVGWMFGTISATGYGSSVERERFCVCHARSSTFARIVVSTSSIVKQPLTLTVIDCAPHRVRDAGRQQQPGRTLDH